MATTSPEGATSAPVADSAVASLTHLCLEAVARHIFQFYNSRLLDLCLGDSTCQSLLHAFDVSIVERLHDDGKLTAVILSHLPTKPSKSSLGLERRFGELLFLEKHALDARDIDRFGLAFAQAIHGSSVSPSTDTPEGAEPVDQTFSTSPKQFEFPPPPEHVHDSTTKGRSLKDLLQRFDTIERLSLVSCCLGTAGVIVLASAINHVKALRVLDLSNDMWAAHKSAYSNRIGDAGAMALASALRTNASVIKVVLSGNPIGPRGGHALAATVRCSNTLQVLHLKQTNVKRAATALIRAFEDSTSLRDLDLEWCHLPPGMGTHLSQVRRHRQDDNLS
ncbi:hypothetical protein H257_01310 [Aphanomyces astaci]|uniref:Uncharacterized protein n=1 Tax=Aphanomyces astaci TaxID=112090 RepID=W4H9V1_APHAT|nr:hypothetical protein H257_01310 [Aphanomyces astaci]ETV87898.1 hypothetical protein H257_01310 [Aphanomyces astaci]|eukprot:XP_009822761.1 hypothetical protein H257_01310 [Aphanomyces astaci]